jgi:RNA polymerase sigma-70 factor (ECF subfamily)
MQVPGINLEEVYKAHGNMAFNLALHYVQNTQDAEEIVQDVFMAFYEAMHTFRDEAKISTLIYRITINKSLDFLKAKKRKKRFALLTSLFSASEKELLHSQKEWNHPGVVLEQRESLKMIFDGINQLPPNQKTALILAKIEHCSQKEIAEIMELNVKAVDSLIQRAKVNLENYLKRAKDNA